MFDRSVPHPGTLADERPDAPHGPPLFVVGILAKAEDQSFRYRKGLG
jgi:hypothetical protein